MAQLYGKNTKVDRDAGAVFHEFLRRNGIDIDKKLIAREIKRQGVKVDPRYLDKVTYAKGGVAKTLALIGRATGATAMGASKLGGKVARPIAALGGAAATLKGKEKENLINYIKGLSKTNTSAVMGPKYNLVGPIGATTPPKY